MPGIAEFIDLCGKEGIFCSVLEMLPFIVKRLRLLDLDKEA